MPPRSAPPPPPSSAQRAPTSAAEGVAVLLILLGVAASIVWFVMTPVHRAEVEFILWTKNEGPLLVSFFSVVGLFLLLGLAMRRKARFLTSAVEDAHAKVVPGPKSRTGIGAYAPHLVFSAAGLVTYAVFYALGDVRWLFFGFLARPELALLRAVLLLTTTLLPAILIPCLVIVFLNGSGAARRWRANLQRKQERVLLEKELPSPGDYQQRATPVFLLGARESQESLRFEPEAKVPSWVMFQAPDIFGGLLVLGRKGSGKTALLLRVIEDAIKFGAGLDPGRRDEIKPAVCIVDQKGDMARFVEETARKYGREADVVRLGVDTPAKWNPFGGMTPRSTALECRQVAFFLRCAMTAGATTTNDHTFWQDNADNLIFRAIHLLALAGEPVGFGSVYRVITSLNAQEKYLDTLFKRAEHAIHLLRASGEAVDDAAQELRDTERYFEEEFTKLDAKVRTTVISVVSNFFQKFMTAQYARSFSCDPRAEGHFAGFSDHIARGGIFVLDVRANQHGTIANALAMLTKLHYQAAVKMRDRYPGDAMKRVTVFVLDEAQACITPSTSNTEGDDKYLEMSRSFKAVDVFATQQYSAVSAAVGKDMAQRIIGSFNNLIVYRHNDPALTEYIQKLIGQQEVEDRNVSVTESSSAAERNVFAVEGETERERQVSRSVSVQRKEKPLVEAATFKSMGVFEAIGFFDRPRGLAITHFYTKPYFVAARMPHAEVLRTLEAHAEASA